MASSQAKYRRPGGVAPIPAKKYYPHRPKQHRPRRAQAHTRSSKPQGKRRVHNPKVKLTAKTKPGKTIGNYHLGETLGEGTFGKVKKGTHVITQESVAVKILEKSRIVEAADIQRVMREIKILKKVHNPNVIQLYEVIDAPDQIYLVMEYLNGGELFDYIVRKQRLSEPNACFIFHQILDGVEYLHKNFVIHRDLKPENLLMHRTRHGWLVKVADFGLSNTCDGNVLLETACGSPCYAAPEMIAGKKYDGRASDLWACGVILFALVAGFLPFEHSDTAMLYKKILNAQYELPSWLSRNVKDLIRRMLVVDPARRIDADAIRKHPFYNAFDVSHKLSKTFDEVKRASSSAHDENPALVAYVMDQMKKKGFQPGVVDAALQKQEKNAVTATFRIMLSRLRERRDIVESLKAPLMKLNIAKTEKEGEGAAEKEAAPASARLPKKEEQHLPKMPLSARGASENSDFVLVPTRPQGNSKIGGATKPGRRSVQQNQPQPRVAEEKGALEHLTSLQPVAILAEIKRTCLVSNFEWEIAESDPFLIHVARGNVKLSVEVVVPKKSPTNFSILIRSLSGNKLTCQKYKKEFVSQLKF